MHGSRGFADAYLIQVLYMFPVVFSWSFSYMYMVDAGFSNLEIFSMKVLDFTAAVAVVLALRRFNVMRMIAVGFFGFSVILAALPFIRDMPSLLLIAVLDGLTFPLFWIPYNRLYFDYGKTGKSAYLAGIGLLISPILSILAPYGSGLIIERWGFVPVFLIGAALLFACGVYYGRLKSETFSIDFTRALRRSRGIRTLVFLQGVYEGVNWTVVPIFTLYFIASSSSYGAFFSCLALFGSISTLYFCRRSDDSGRRTGYLYPSIIIAAAATSYSAFSSNLEEWLIARAVVGFFLAIASPFVMSIVLDRVKDVAEAMYVREIMLNSGRAAGISVVIACELFFSFQYALLPAGLLLMAYPLIVEYKGIYGRGLRLDAITAMGAAEKHD